MSIHTVLKLPNGMYVKIKNNQRPFVVTAVSDICQATVFSNHWISDDNKAALYRTNISSFTHVPVRVERKVIEL